MAYFASNTIQFSISSLCRKVQHIFLIIMSRGSLSFALIAVILCAGVQARESSFLQYSFLLKGEVCDFGGEFEILCSIPALFLNN